MVHGFRTYVAVEVKIKADTGLISVDLATSLPTGYMAC